MMGADDGFSEISSVENPNLQTQACKGILKIPPNKVKWENVRSKQSLEIKGIKFIHLKVSMINCDTYHDT
jgi:hypothetical protein